MTTETTTPTLRRSAKLFADTAEAHGFELTNVRAEEYSLTLTYERTLDEHPAFPADPEGPTINFGENFIVSAIGEFDPKTGRYFGITLTDESGRTVNPGKSDTVTAHLDAMAARTRVAHRFEEAAKREKAAKVRAAAVASARELYFRELEESRSDEFNRLRRLKEIAAREAPKTGELRLDGWGKRELSGVIADRLTTRLADIVVGLVGRESNRSTETEIKPIGVTEAIGIGIGHFSNELSDARIVEEAAKAVIEISRLAR